MKQAWRLGGVALLALLSGCSGTVDLGSSEAPTIAALGAGLVNFSRAPSGMCALFDNHRTYCWGELGSTIARRAPQLDGVALAGAGSQGEMCGLDAQGTVSCTLAIDEKRSKKLGVPPAVEVSVGFFGGCALDADGRIHCWPFDGETLCGASNEDWLNLELPSRAVQVAFAEGHGCAVTEDGKLYCFGTNVEGESGQPSQTSCVGRPTAVSGLDDVARVTLGMDYTCALRRSGRVTCFGYSSNLGTGVEDALSTTEGPRLIDVPGLEGVVALESSRIATCALESTGRLKCWGESECGSLGIAEDCDFTRVTTPIAVQSALEVEKFGMDDGLTCVLTLKGEVKCWGFSGWDGHALGSPLPRNITFQ
jgi:hypothetical protein